jgi:hypothetical protein
MVQGNLGGVVALGLGRQNARSGATSDSETFMSAPCVLILASSSSRVDAGRRSAV